MISPRHAGTHPAVWLIGWAVTTGTWAAEPARADSPFYVASELGGNFASTLQTSGTSNDRASVCEEFINPMFATVTRSAGYEHYNCTGAQRGRGSGWKNGFDRAEGLVAGAVPGYRLSQRFPERFWDRFSVELEYWNICIMTPTTITQPTYRAPAAPRATNWRRRSSRPRIASAGSPRIMRC